MPPVPLLTWSSVSSTNPMGQQQYEESIKRAIRSLANDDWRFRDLRFRPMRDRDRVGRRTPVGLRMRAPRVGALALGVFAYTTRSLVHRMDLSLPPHFSELVTVHDIAPLRFQDEGRIPKSAAHDLRAARKVIAPSDFAAGELCDTFGLSNVEVIYNGYDRRFASTAPIGHADRTSLGISESAYILHSGGASSRKNLDELAKAWVKVRTRAPDLELVLAGPPHVNRTRAFHAVSGAVLLGRVRPNLLRSLVAGATAVVVPSVYEGFGLPAIEAMAAGVPVIAARAAALPEICGEAALLVEPTAEGISDGILRTVTDADLGAELRSAGKARAKRFSWETAASRHLELYQRFSD